MFTFVAMKGDEAAERALCIIRETTWLKGCGTRTLVPQDGVAGSEEVAFFTSDTKIHWPSKWLRIPQEQRRHNPLPPDWAKAASRTIAIRPRDNINQGDGFVVAVRNAVSNLTGLKQPLPAKQPTKEPRHSHLRPYLR